MSGLLPEKVDWDGTGMMIPENLPLEEWKGLAPFFSHMAKSLQWVYGDWENYGRDHWGEIATQYFDENMYSNGTLRNSAYVCRKIEKARRRPELSHSHHYEVASLPPDVQDEFLQLAIDNGWRCRELREAVRDYKNPPIEAKIEEPCKTEERELSSRTSSIDDFLDWLAGYLQTKRWSAGEKAIASKVAKEVYTHITGEG